MTRQKRDEHSVPPTTRLELEAMYGKVWDHDELVQEFEITAIVAPHAVIRRKLDGVVGTVEFQARSMYYHSFRPQTVSE